MWTILRYNINCIFLAQCTLRRTWLAKPVEGSALIELNMHLPWTALMLFDLVDCIKQVDLIGSHISKRLDNTRIVVVVGDSINY